MDLYNFLKEHYPISANDQLHVISTEFSFTQDPMELKLDQAKLLANLLGLQLDELVDKIIKTCDPG